MFSSFRRGILSGALLMAVVVVSCTGSGGGSRAGETRSFPLGSSGVSIEMVWCPPGTFLMGSPKSEQDMATEEGIKQELIDAEGPQHEVTLSKGFWLGKYEVTQAQWKAVMGRKSSYSSCGGSTCPVEEVSWDDIYGEEGFLSKIGNGFRLPTEAEWEYAARAGGQHAGPFVSGTCLSTSDWNYDGNLTLSGCSEGPRRRKAVPVDSMPNAKNAWGLYHIHGNVSEWCADWYVNDYYTIKPSLDPHGPGFGGGRILRGGSYFCFDIVCRFAFRDFNEPGESYAGFGFRLARTP